MNVFASNTTYNDDRPFAWMLLTERSGIIRSKGLFWLAFQPDDAINRNQAGGSLRAEKAGAYLIKSGFPGLQRENRRNREFGDSYNELVIIGRDIDLIT
ncbi:CobW C-terminal domain-containing protein [Chitinophaga sancti]|uniref:Cobalamin synthesis protein cobW C-terminal domain-containing protein n=1 Tax=Chitinophaga sancti TaxID=1004 RepID=A0A1K1SBE6_9BACT|nr:GTP-binding protein [Chitinophaga sancti]WQD63552.1 GTP-binding protein [Chitinophaga sancti]WQG90822.1 GTP-binding protein [Chitinophaga sancti]SFW81691.1 Cobalamin synthesis protein cobW C-terminal domain-containing protein [Chitinophaga sancti]